MTSTSVKVSIVIPVYNIGDVIGRTLESIFAQTESSFEIICVNDGSTDGGKTLAVLDSYAAKDSRIRVITQKNAGPDVARSYGVTLANGKYVYVCDQDDILHPQLLEYCLWVVETYRVEFLAFCHQSFADEDCQINPLPGDFALIPHIVADSTLRKTSPQDYLRAHQLHIDPWVHFSSAELARKVLFSADTSLSRPFALIQMASRWVLSSAILYFYNRSQQNSMTHCSVSLERIARLRKEVQTFFDLYAEERAKGDPIGLWEQQCQNYMIKLVKMTYNMIRCGKSLSKQARNERLQLFTNILYDFFAEKKIAFRHVAFKHKIAYILLFIKFFPSYKKLPKDSQM